MKQPHASGNDGSWTMAFIDPSQPYVPLRTHRILRFTVDKLSLAVLPGLGHLRHMQHEASAGTSPACFKFRKRSGQKVPTEKHVLITKVETQEAVATCGSHNKLRAIVQSQVDTIPDGGSQSSKPTRSKISCTVLMSAVLCAGLLRASHSGEARLEDGSLKKYQNGRILA